MDSTLIPTSATGMEVDDDTRLQAFAIISEVSATLADEDDVEEMLGRFLGTMLRLQLNEHWTDKDVRETAKAIRKVAAFYA